MLGLTLAEAGLVPDPLLRWAIRRMLAERLGEVMAGDPEEQLARKREFLEAMRKTPVAVATEAANEQHYEVAPAFFEAVLGPWLKYSCGFWESADDDLARSEERMLALTATRAGVEDGMRVLDLGCGWGSFSLWVAEHHPGCRVLAVSNSAPQREHIERRCRERGLANVEVVTADVNDFEPAGLFDRVVSIEMFEHVRNHEPLMARIARWLAPGGRLFVHHFCHREAAYPYEDRGDGDWMARHFFTGGIMPSEDLLLRCRHPLVPEAQWRVPGTHYEKTSNAWLARMDARRDRVLPILAEVYGERDARRWLQRWRLFFLACAELFGYRGGTEWFVAHHRFARPGEGGA